MTKTPITYKSAGVDIDAGNDLVERIKPLSAATKRAGVMSGLGGFGAFFDLKAAGYNDPILVAATDGVGTKLKLAIETEQLTTVGIDLVAMCVNDLICQGAEPLFFLDYFATGALDPTHATDVIAGIAEGCQIAGCGLIGGETAEMPGMYKAGDFDLAGFAVGALERGTALPNAVDVGDVLLGLASTGVHSNGYSLVRRVVEAEGLAWSDAAPFSNAETLGAALLTPTALYVKSAKAALDLGGVKAFAHITGGGITENVPRILPNNMGAEIDLSSWTAPPVFSWLINAASLDPTEALKTFNCGIGLVAVVAADQADDLSKALAEDGHSVTTIGHVTDKGGVHYSGALL